MFDQLRSKIQAGELEFTKHAADQSILRRISIDEVQYALTTGQIIEDYPDDKYRPSCLVLGFTHEGRPLHIQCSYPSPPLIKIITIYEPDPKHWIEFKVRKSSNDS